MKAFQLIFFFALLSPCMAQSTIDKYSSDTKSVESAVTAALACISGDKGAARDWERFRNLFLPTAQLNAVFHKNDSTWVSVNSLDDFIVKAGTWYVDNGFHEYAIKNQIDIFGNIAHVFQSYGAKTEDDGEIGRGINSYQLAFDKGRWWIVNLIWDSETEEIKIPEKYLKH